MSEPAYKKVRRDRQRKALLQFLLDNLLPDYIDYELLDDIKDFVQAEAPERGEYGAFCDYFGLGRWFETKMEDCKFDIQDFFDEYAKEIEWRAAP